jgi:hypothetical protein
LEGEMQAVYGNQHAAVYKEELDTGWLVIQVVGNTQDVLRTKSLVAAVDAADAWEEWCQIHPAYH